MMGLMFYLSSDRFSVEHTQGMVERFLEYGLLGGLLFRAFRGESILPWRMAWVVYSGLVVIAWAAMDELRQTFSPVRHGSLGDALLDVSGGLSMLLLISLYYRHSVRKRPGKYEK